MHAKINAFLKDIEYQLNVTVFAITVGWLAGLILPTLYLS